MKAILDTHTFLWWVTNNPKLSSKAKGFISDEGNELFFSAASAWEIVTKAQLGKLVLPKEPTQFIAEQIVINTFSSLAISVQHGIQIYNLPTYHRDPFDRILIAQSQLEKMPVITADSQFAQYGVQTIW